MSGELALLWLTAVAMAIFTAWLVKKGSEVETLNDASILLFLLVMMASMFASTVYYLYYPGFLSAILLVILNMVIMGVALVPVLAAWLLGDRKVDDLRKGSRPSVRRWVEGSVIVLVIASELFMGWTFAILSGSVPTAPSLAAVYSALVSSSASYWFVFTMCGEMAVTLLALRKKFPGGVKEVVAAQAAIMFFSPTAIADRSWADFALLGGSAVMIVLFIYFFEYLYKNRTLDRRVMNYLVSVMFAYALMMAGIFSWLLDGNASLFVVSLVIEMVVYFAFVLGRHAPSPGLRGWQSAPYWLLGMLGLLFVAEFFMGAALDVYAYGATYFTGIQLAPVGGLSLGALGAAASDFLVLFGSVTASPWYLIMMGIEMGSLVVFKIRTVREFETKVRLGMVVIAYAVYAIFLPYFFFPNPQYVPWVGWSMGIGTAGAIAPDVVLALVASYFISGVLSLLFGSRNVCSVFCTAALMYQGTAYDAMSSFNRTSTIGRKLLTSRLSSAYKLVASLVWVSLIGAAALSYLNSVGLVNVTVFGTDTAFFLYTFYFSFLWYIVWILIPFMGTYACATTGMCGWGSFNQLISRLGFFKLKVMNSDTCVRCETKDCAKVCPVGITDQPGSFIASGELKSMKCIGVGDCVSACPYENIYFYDVRGWIRKKLHQKEPATPLAQLGAPLPIRAHDGEL